MRSSTSKNEIAIKLKIGIKPDVPENSYLALTTEKHVITRRIYAKKEQIHVTVYLYILVKNRESVTVNAYKVRSKQITASLRSSVITDQKYSPEAILLSQGLRNVSTQTVKNEIETMSLYIEGKFCTVTYKL